MRSNLANLLPFSPPVLEVTLVSCPDGLIYSLSIASMSSPSMRSLGHFVWLAWFRYGSLFCSFDVSMNIPQNRPFRTQNEFVVQEAYTKEWDSRRHNVTWVEQRVIDPIPEVIPQVLH